MEELDHSEDFIAATGYSGRRPGYDFRHGSLGIGYLLRANVSFKSINLVLGF